VTKIEAGTADDRTTKGDPRKREVLRQQTPQEAVKFTGVAWRYGPLG